MLEKEELTNITYLFIGVCFLVFMYVVQTNSSPTRYLTEPFTNYSLGTTYGDYPTSEIDVLVQDSYPITGINGVSQERLIGFGFVSFQNLETAQKARFDVKKELFRGSHELYVN